MHRGPHCINSCSLITNLASSSSSSCSSTPLRQSQKDATAGHGWTLVTLRRRMYSYKVISHWVKRQRSCWSWLAVVEKASKCNKPLGRVSLCSSILWKWPSPLTRGLFCFCADTLLLISSWQQHQRWNEGAGAFWELLCWLTTEVDMQTASQPNIQLTGWPQGWITFYAFPNRGGVELLMCLSRLPSIAANEVLSASVKCSAQIQQPNWMAVTETQKKVEWWSETDTERDRERDRERERERERERVFTRHALISTKLSLGFREGRTVDQGTAGERGRGVGGAFEHGQFQISCHITMQMVLPNSPPFARALFGARLRVLTVY